MCSKAGLLFIYFFNIYIIYFLSLSFFFFLYYSIFFSPRKLVSAPPVKALPTGLEGGRKQHWQPAGLYQCPVQAAERLGSTGTCCRGGLSIPRPSSMAVDLAELPPFPHSPRHIRPPARLAWPRKSFRPEKLDFEHFLLFSLFPVAFPRTTSLTSSSPGAGGDAAAVRAPSGNPTRVPRHPAAGRTGPAAGCAKMLFWVDPVRIFVEVGGQR